MNDEPCRVIIGSFEGGANAVTIPSAALQAAEAALDRAAEERAAIRPTLQVDREWFLATMRAHIAYVERDRAEAAWWGDRTARAALGRKARHLREDLDQVLAYNDRKPKP